MPPAHHGHFSKNGKVLKPLGNTSPFSDNTGLSPSFFSEEIITSLADVPLDSKMQTHNLYNLILRMFAFLGVLSDRLLNWLQVNMLQLLGPRTAATWITSSIAFYTIFTGIILLRPIYVATRAPNKYISYATKPLTIETAQTNIYARDSRSERINGVFKKYKCPLEGLGEVFVYEADKNNIPWWLVASVAFQESSCGKNTPEPNGVESFNAWGWGVYGDNIYMFDNWARGVETVSKYFQDKFFSKGITNTCDIMRVYTPPSNGSWCEGVNYFGEVFQTFKTDHKVDN